MDPSLSSAGVMDRTAVAQAWNIIIIFKNPKIRVLFMKTITLDPSNLIVLPTRRSPPKQWKLDSLEQAFLSGNSEALPPVIIFERAKDLIVADGNHRILLAMKYQTQIPGIQLEGGEEFTLKGNPTLNYGKHKDYPYANFGTYALYIDYCRMIAKLKGFDDFRALFDRFMIKPE